MQLDKNKAESEETEETSETKVGTRRNKKFDTNSNNKKHEHGPTSLRAVLSVSTGAQIT